MSLSIDVVLPTHNRWDLTERCLTLLRNQTVAHSVVVADNASTDPTRERIRESFPEVQLVRLPGNLGFPAACNRGAAAGRAEVIVLLNNDVEVAPEFLDRLVRPFGENPKVGSSAALLVRPGGKMIDSMGLTADSTLASFPRLRGRPTREARAVQPVLSGPCGAAGAYRRTAWEAVGGLDEGVRFYGEDLDLALRIRSGGWNTVATPEAMAIHLGSATIGPRSASQRYQSGFARSYFARRYGLHRSRTAPRLLTTEAAVALGDAILSHDLSAVRGRLAGWRSADGAARRSFPPHDAIDTSIGFLESLRLRRDVYAT